MRPEEVAVVDEADYDAVGDRWSDLMVHILLRRSMEAGDFPLALQLSSRADRPEDFLAVVRIVSRELGAPILTDEIEAQFDDDYLLVAPSGATVIVTERLDDLDSDEPAIILVPESRALYESLVHRPLVATG
ncbi:MAG: hypothetical protein M3457_00580 [Chloroflexota bacterium]|nr:hypothetical protein [Chloroflexota bacterium]